MSFFIQIFDWLATLINQVAFTKEMNTKMQKIGFLQLILVYLVHAMVVQYRVKMLFAQLNARNQYLFPVSAVLFAQVLLIYVIYYLLAVFLSNG